MIGSEADSVCTHELALAIAESHLVPPCHLQQPLLKAS